MVIGSERIGMGTKQGAALGLSLGIGHMRLSIRSGHWGLSLWGLGDALGLGDGDEGSIN